MDPKNTLEKLKLLKSNIEERIVGKSELVDDIIIALISEGHVLIEDVPGVGKTTLAKALADSLSLSFSRIQCTPDTMPSDISGVSIYNKKTGEFELLPGPVINNIVLADELNRTTPKTQSALLEAMEEKKVTIDGRDQKLPAPFMVIGTQNPAESTGTYPLPEAQLDRFMMKLTIGYPQKEASFDMAESFLKGNLLKKTEPILKAEDILDICKEVKSVTVNEELINYAINITEATRNKPEIAWGASPRALLSLLRCAQAKALYKGRDYCIPEDILDSALLTLPHRLILSPQARMNRLSPNKLLKSITLNIKVR
ncbi:MAG: MoxR family ATPase [Lachnospiraceae bacterium]|nr:MoxR family ATPase [Lachnospiraceae bacterium]